MTLRVLIYDDRPLTSDGVAGLLTGEPDLEVVGTAATRSQALRMLHAEAPDVVVIGLCPEGAMDAPFVRELVGRILDRPALVVYTPHPDQSR
ncbi:response regulator transcription factor [Actinoplanes sp. NPDC020271]|uniref:response regulator transcription factor n=1 Tax=Actinoplanes sp. NPDC020271 TaxID=3363896 RepID=UPI0037963E19